jgi:hypothetical protein
MKPRERGIKRFPGGPLVIRLLYEMILCHEDDSFGCG